MEKTVPFSREDEQELTRLQSHIDAGETLSREEELLYVALETKSKEFLDQGMRRLEEGVPKEKGSKWHRVLGVVGSTAATVGSATMFWGSMAKEAVPGIVGRYSGLAPNHSHWSFITDRLIMGALPVLTTISRSGGHLEKLKADLVAFGNLRLGLVIACLLPEEVNGFGVPAIRFAHAEDWAAVFDPTPRYMFVPIIDQTANVTHKDVAVAVKAIYEATQQDSCVYVHCRLGRGRSWLIAMCYLTCIANMSVAGAAKLINAKRSQVSPSDVQVQFVQRHLRWYRKSRLGRERQREDHERIRFSV